jgi:hypothetical protein
VGSGILILSNLLLKNGNRVFGVEPNPEMRAAAEEILYHHPRFASVLGTAEATTHPDVSVDFVVAGQAFHNGGFVEVIPTSLPAFLIGHRPPARMMPPAELNRIPNHAFFRQSRK